MRKRMHSDIGRIDFKVSDEIAIKIKEKAISENKSVSQYSRKLLIKWIEQEKLQCPK